MSLTTRTAEYNTLHTLADASSAVDTDLAAATGYATGAPAGSVDLLGINGAGKDTYANAVSLKVDALTGADGDTVTQVIYGIAPNGPPQRIASIVWTLGTARSDGATATSLYADTAVVTSTHITTIKVADGAGSGRVCSVSFDVAGYRYLYGLFTAQTGDPTLVTCNYRAY